MSARFEIVRTDAPQPWHARFRAANGRVVWTTENYSRKRNAIKAIGALSFAVLPEKPSGWVVLDALGDLIEVRDVDERYVAPPVVLEPPFYHTTTRPILDLGTRKARYGPVEDFWHDHAYHYRQCSGTTDQGGDCTEAIPPAGSTVRGRFGSAVTP